MAILVDLILIAVLALCVFLGWKKGFVKTLSGFLVYVFSFAIANACHRFVENLVLKLPFLSGMLTDMEMPTFSDNATFLDKVKEVVRFSVDHDTEAGAVVEAMAKNYIAEMLASVIAFILVFVISVILLKLLVWVLDAVIQKFPVVNKANGVLGAVIGLLNGFIWTWAISNLFVNALHPFLQTLWPKIFVPEIADSFIVKFCTTINPITYLFELINWIS